MLRTNDSRSPQSRAQLQVSRHLLEVTNISEYVTHDCTASWHERVARGAGAAIAGGTHYVATAKRLVEEGIDPTQRMKAMPVAVGAVFW